MSAEAKYPWSVLGLPKMPDDAAMSRKAYARALKQIDQSKDINGFETLRSAYDRAMHLHKMANRAETAPQDNTDSALQTDAQPIAPAPPPQTPLQTPPQAPLQTQMPPSATAMQAADLQTKAAPPDGVPNLQMTLQALGTIRSDVSFSTRVKDALDSPWAKDPMTAGAIRTGIAAALRAMPIRHWAEHDNLHLEITADILHRLDSEYRWLTDATSFERDFGQSFDLMHHLLVRVSGGSIPKFRTPEKKINRLQRIIYWIGNNGPAAYFMFLMATITLTAISFGIGMPKLAAAFLFLLLGTIFMSLFFFVAAFFFALFASKLHRLTSTILAGFWTVLLIYVLYLQNLTYFAIFAASAFIFLVSLSFFGAKKPAIIEAHLQSALDKLKS